ncbi:putative thiazole-containing bacteriocin maturation protein [Paenibacillus abyssi]|nr:putative thiazole-containing bacteriocin maturation protein [Paenibacillus abyssi]
MRLKVKGDTFFLPEPNGSVYFRNNTGSFRMEGSAIDQWIEKLMPVFDGNYTMADLTDGLPDEYRNRVIEIAESLHRNGFVKDVSQDRTHELPGEIVAKYAAQIAFLDSLGDSGAYRFQSYREAKVLAVGSGPFLVSLVGALLESGLPHIHMLIGDPQAVNLGRIAELAQHVRKTDPTVEVKEVNLQPNQADIPWREVVQPFDAILYVSQEGDNEQWRALHAACREEKKVLLPAMIVQQSGMAGPLVHPDSENCWESAWHRLHETAICKDPQLHAFSSTAGAMLANVIVFECLKTLAGVGIPDREHHFYLLDLETLEGSWHTFLPHPIVSGAQIAEPVSDMELRLGQFKDESRSNDMIAYFSGLTSSECGIFHIWEEGDLKQLPLAQCRVQAVDPLSVGPAKLFPEMVCTGLTHEEARRDAGLSGLEAYGTAMAGMFMEKLSFNEKGVSHSARLQPFTGVGAGETAAEAAARALYKCLLEEFTKKQGDRRPSVFRVQLSEVEDERCRFYLRALTTMQGAPMIGMGEEVCGFPVLWVGTSGSGWYGSVGLSPTLALRTALQHSLRKAQNKQAFLPVQALEASSVQLQENQLPTLAIPSCDTAAYPKLMASALRILKQERIQLSVIDLAMEPFMKGRIELLGVSLGKGELK